MSAAQYYVKTPKGLEEVTQRCHGLAQRHRRLLIMIDGKKDAEALAAMMPGEDATAHLAMLLAEGYVIPLQPETPADTPAANGAAADRVPAPANDAQRIDMARNFMLNTLNAFVGIAASGLITRIESCISIAHLQELYGGWRDAINLSSDGRKRLPELEGRLAPLLS